MNDKLQINVEIQCNHTVAEVQKIPFDVQSDIVGVLLDCIVDELEDLGFDLAALADAVECLAVGCRDAAGRPADAGLQ